MVVDVAIITQALVTLDRRYNRTPGWEALADAPSLGWSALACALDAGLEEPDYTVDLRGWRPPTKLIRGPAKAGLLGVLQAEHNLVIRMASFPAAINLRLVVDSQKLLSLGLLPLAATTKEELHHGWGTRAQTYTELQQRLRDIGGTIGAGGLAAAEGANAFSRLRALPPDVDAEPRILQGFDTLFKKLDARIADVIDQGIARKVYFARVKVPHFSDTSRQITTQRQERYFPVSTPERDSLLEFVNAHLRPPARPPRAPAGAARSRANLAAALVHRPTQTDGSLAI